MKRDLSILFYSELPLMPSKTSSCNRNYQILKIFLEKGLKITYTHGYFIEGVEKEIEELKSRYKNFKIAVPIYKNLSVFNEHDLFWITEVWDINRLRSALSLAYRAKVVYNLPVVLDIMDCIYKHYFRQKEQGINYSDKELDIVYELEKKLYDVVDIIIFVSEEERNFVIKEYNVNREKTFIISNIHYPCSDIHFNSKKSLCFVGHMKNLNNFLAIKFFLNEIYPYIIEKDPEVEFHVIGDGTETLRLEELLEDKNTMTLIKKRVYFRGWVRDINQELRRHKLSVAPLISGAGIKGKILNSLECGVPVVTTPIGAEGFFEIESSGIVVAKTPREFAEEVLRLFKDETLRRDLAQKGLKYVKKWFSRECAEKTIEEILVKISQSHQERRPKDLSASTLLSAQYVLSLPQNYIKVTDCEEVIQSVLTEFKDQFDIIFFNYLDVYNTVPLIRPFLLEDPPESFKWLPAIVKANLQEKLIAKGEIRVFYVDTFLCYNRVIYERRILKKIIDRIIEWGMRKKMFFKRNPRLERIAKKIYHWLMILKTK